MSRRDAGSGGWIGRAVAQVRPDLPRSVQTLQVGGLLNALGNGLVLPFLVIYLHSERGVPLGISGLIVATASGVSLVATPVAGALIDHVGSRACLFVALGLLTLGYAGYALVHQAWQGFAAAAVAGLGNGCFWPSQSSLLAGLASREQRAATFAMQRVTMNLGVGLGALIGGLAVSSNDPASFQRLFLGDALTFLAYAAVLTRVPGVPRQPHAAGGAPSRYTDVLRHRPFMGLIALNLAMIAGGIALIDVFPAYVKAHAGLNEREIGWVFLVNTLVIVTAQLPLARLLQGHRRMAALAVVSLVWAVSWLLVPLVAALASGVAATVALAAVLGLFGIGECFHGAVQAPLVTDLADHRLLGRYMALSALSWNVAFVVGPAIGGFVLGAAPSALWLGAAAVLVGAAAAALALERTLPAEVRRSPRRTGRQQPLRIDAIEQPAPSSPS
jgi:MFS family permease